MSLSDAPLCPACPAAGHRARRILVAGTLAFDYVCTYPGLLRSLPQHPGINLSVQLGGFERRFGGCAMNIAYTLKQLGDDPTPVAVVGQDFRDSDYAGHLRQTGIDMSGLVLAEAPHSAHGFIFTDREQNQFTGFFGGPGAAAEALAWPAKRLPALLQEASCDYAVLAPDMPANMIAAARVLRRLGVDFLTDPGQNLTDFAPADAKALLELTDALVVNEYEHATLRKMASEQLDAVALLVVTRGPRGCFWRSQADGNGEEQAVRASAVDSTGCGDAFRPGFVHARLRGAPLHEAVRSGSTAAAIVVEVAGTQRHQLARGAPSRTRAEGAGNGFRARYRSAWGNQPAWLGQP